MIPENHNPSSIESEPAKVATTKFPHPYIASQYPDGYDQPPKNNRQAKKGPPVLWIVRSFILPSLTGGRVSFCRFGLGRLG